MADAHTPNTESPAQKPLPEHPQKPMAVPSGKEERIITVPRYPLDGSTFASFKLKPEEKPHTFWLHYWALTKAWARECYRTWRGEVLASAITIVFLFLITRNAFDFTAALLATAYTIAAFSVWHLIRIPWRLHTNWDECKQLNSWWGMLGMTIATGNIVLLAWTALWFYTMQPPVSFVHPSAPDSRDARIAMLEQQVKKLTPDQRSLKVRLAAMADAIAVFGRERQKHSPTCTQTSQMTPEQQREVIAPCAKYGTETELLYENKFAPYVLGLIAEAKAKGIDVRNIENCAGSGFCGISIPVQLRAFAEELDVHDNVKR